MNAEFLLVYLTYLFQLRMIYGLTFSNAAHSQFDGCCAGGLVSSESSLFAIVSAFRGRNIQCWSQQFLWQSLGDLDPSHSCLYSSLLSCLPWCSPDFWIHRTTFLHIFFTPVVLAAANQRHRRTPFHSRTCLEHPVWALDIRDLGNSFWASIQRI